MAKILLIEDDTSLASVVLAALEAEHHTVEASADGTEGYERITCSEFDLAVIDWNLPGLSGPEIVRNVRNNNIVLPIIMLTARGTISDKETGYTAGADDYLTKPFEMKELALRIRALLRRKNSADDVLRVKDMELDARKFTVKKAGVDITLLPREFALLEFFMRHPGDVFSTEQLIRSVWPSDANVAEDAVKSALKRLRQKIDGDSTNSIIETIPRVGYRMPT